MKKIASLFIAVLFSLSGLLAQSFQLEGSDTTNRKDQHGQKQGFWIEKSGRIEFRGNYISDQKDGLWRSYHHTGLLNAVDTYKKGKRHGLSLTIDRRGFLKKEAMYVDGKLNGTYREFSYGGRPIKIMEYRNGLLNGLKKLYYNGKPDKVLEESYYKNGKKDGIAKWFSEDGLLIAEYQYKNGSFEGIQKNYYEDGSVLSEEMYENNVPIGTYHEYFPDGTNKVVGEYDRGEKHGKWLEYDEHGKIVKQVKFNHGVEKK